MNDFDNCLAKVLNAIKVIQDNASKIECIDNSCTKPFLGINNNSTCFNTRPIVLYRCDNSPITLNYTSDGVEATSSIFRVESVTNDSVGVLLLIEQEDESGNITYQSTNTYSTINLGCVCAIRCLNDTTLNNI